MPVSFSKAADKYDVIVIGSGLGGLTSATDLPIVVTVSSFLNIIVNLVVLPPGSRGKAISLMSHSMDFPMAW